MSDPSAAADSVVARAAVFRGPSDVRVIETSIRAPGAEEVRVRLEGCGVCGSNLPVWEGRPWFQYPLAPGAPGHEGWGVIDSVGSDVHDFAVGDRVALLSGHAFAEYDIARSDSLVRLPQALDGRVFPGEALGCAMNIFRRSDIQPGQTVAIVGIGFLGAILTMLASRAGGRVIALSRRRYALELAEQFGAAHVISLDDSGRALGEARGIVGEKGCERVIEAVGTQDALDVAAELAGIRAKLIIAGYHQDGPRQVNLQQWNWRGIDVINAHERDPAQYRRGIEDAVSLVMSGAFDPRPLFTHSLPIEDAAEAFTMLARRPHGFLKALVVCGPQGSGSRHGLDAASGRAQTG